MSSDNKILVGSFYFYFNMSQRKNKTENGLKQKFDHNLYLALLSWSQLAIAQKGFFLPATILSGLF